jgi:hypothetical protein
MRFGLFGSSVCSVMGDEPRRRTPHVAGDQGGSRRRSGGCVGGGGLCRHPFTEPIWFINAPFDAVVQETAAWLATLATRRSFTRVDAPLPVMLDSLEPWAPAGWKHLLVATTGDWTAVFSQGDDIGTPNVVGDRLGSLNMRTHYRPRIVRDGQTLSHGDCALWINNGFSAVRNIQATFQSRWGWLLYGEPQPFEDLDAYTAKRIPDRFTLERLNDYCRAMGVQREQTNFYQPVGVLIEEDTSTWPNRPLKQMPGSEWRAANT